jgi:hypothetical protein
LFVANSIHKNNLAVMFDFNAIKGRGDVVLKRVCSELLSLPIK